MARAKYKIGTFVKVAETSDAAAHYGAVEEIHLTQAGTAYKLTGLEEAVTEEEIEQGYRPMVTRASKPRAAKGASKKSKRDSSAQAAA